MRIFIAGASGAIGLPLIAELVRRGHTVTGMTSSEAGAKKIIERGAAAEAGVYNIVDDDPSTVSVWLPRFAQWLGAPPPPEITERVALETVGEDAVYQQTRLRGASNAKAGKILNFRPRRLEWLTALRAPA